MRLNFVKLAVLSLCLACAGRHAAFADAATEAQLRAALQNATAQIATLEDQVANLQASQAPDVATIEALRAQLQNFQTAGNAGTASTSLGKAKDDAALAALSRRLAARNAAFEKSQSEYAAAANAAATAGAKNTALQTQLASLNTGLSSCQAKNTQLFIIGNQILNAYSHKDDVFGAIADREPFTGLKRVQLENIVQDYQDKLYGNRLTPGGSAP